MKIHTAAGDHVTTTIVKVNRRSNTPSGNPRWRLITQHGVFETEPDTQVSHMITDRLTDKGRRRGLFDLTLNSAGRVIGLTEILDGKRVSI